MSRERDSAFRVESPSFYRLSHDLARYRFPARLNIQKVELDPTCDCPYTSVDDQVQVLVTLDGIIYTILILAPTASVNWHLTVLPRNTVLVPSISGLTVAQALVGVVERGLDPRADTEWEDRLKQLLGEDYDEILPPSKTRPTIDELAATLERAGVEKPRYEAFSLRTLWREPRYPIYTEIQDIERQIQDLLDAHCTTGRPPRHQTHCSGSLIRELRWKPDASPIDLVEMLLCHELPLTRGQYHLVADEIHKCWQRVGPFLVPWPK